MVDVLHDSKAGERSSYRTGIVEAMTIPSNLWTGSSTFYSVEQGTVFTGSNHLATHNLSLRTDLMIQDGRRHAHLAKRPKIQKLEVLTTADRE